MSVVYSGLIIRVRVSREVSESVVVCAWCMNDATEIITGNNNG